MHPTIHKRTESGQEIILLFLYIPEASFVIECSEFITIECFQPLSLYEISSLFNYHLAK